MNDSRTESLASHSHTRIVAEQRVGHKRHRIALNASNRSWAWRRENRPVGVTVAYADLETPPHALDTYLHGSPKEVAEALVGYEELGVAHIMVRTIPSTMIGLTRLTEALHAYGRISAGAST